MLDNQSKLNPTTAFYAALGSGGGGGSVGPNLTLSTLTFGNAFATAVFFPSSQTTNLQAESLSFTSVTTGAQIYIDAAGISGSPPDGNATISFDSGSYIQEDFNQNFMILAGGNGSVSILGDVSISSITCSTINGVAPGGGGATVSTFTDLTVSNPTAAGATLNLRASDTNLYAINCVSSSVALAGMAVGLVGGRNQVYMNVAEVPQLFVSSINGGIPYTTANPPPAPPAPVAPTVKYFQFIPENQTIGSGMLPTILNYSTITPSPVYSSINGFTLSGGLTCSVLISGNGNTNPMTNVAGNSNANFGLYMILDGNYVPLTSGSFTTAGNSSPAGQYNSTAPSFNSNTNQGAFIVQPNYAFNSPVASPGVEFTYTAWGAHTFQLFGWTDLFMNSGDPTANYTTELYFPKNVQVSGTTGMLVQTF